MGVRLQWIKQAPNPHPNPSPTGKGFEVREWAIFLLLVLQVERGDVCTKTPLLVAKPQAKLPLSFFMPWTVVQAVQGPFQLTLPLDRANCVSYSNQNHRWGILHQCRCLLRLTVSACP